MWYLYFSIKLFISRDTAFYNPTVWVDHPVWADTHIMGHNGVTSFNGAFVVKKRSWRLCGGRPSKEIVNGKTRDTWKTINSNCRRLRWREIINNNFSFSDSSNAAIFSRCCYSCCCDGCCRCNPHPPFNSSICAFILKLHLFSTRKRYFYRSSVHQPESIKLRTVSRSTQSECWICRCMSALPSV